MDWGVPLNKLLSEGRSGNVAVEHFVVTEEESKRTAIRASWRPDEFVEAGAYTRLKVNGRVMMSDTRMEKRSNLAPILNAHGDVLICGLGLGMILQPILAKKEVKSVTVVEKSADVISLVAKCYTNKCLNIVHADAFEWKPVKGQRFDYVWLDIWKSYGDNAEEITKLKRRYCHWLKPGGKVAAWQEGR